MQEKKRKKKKKIAARNDGGAVLGAHLQASLVPLVFEC